MTSPRSDFNDTWHRVVDMLFAGTDVQGGTPQPLAPNQRALLRSVQPVGMVNGFVLLATGNEVVQTLVEKELSPRIERALNAVTGAQQKVVLTISDDSDDAGSAAGPDAMAGSGPDGMDGAAGPGMAPGPAMGGAYGRGIHRPGAGQGHGTHPDAAQTGPQYRMPDRGGLADGYVPGATQGGMAQTQASQSNDPTAWRTLEFDRGSHDTPEAGDPRTTSAMSPQSGPSQAIQGTAAELFGNGKFNMPGLPNPMGEPVEEPTLNPKYTFETFVIGPQNRFAAAAAAAVAEQPARAYNPLFISGGSGLGKTHLLHAIGHYATALDPNLRVRYVSSEEFTNDFINSVRDDAQESFKRRYRDLDILIVDDIQFLEGKEGTQEEFFHTFNALHQADRQIVLSSDRPPRELKTLEERLRTRFEWGLTPDLQLPDLETRIAILSKKAQLDRLNVPHDVLQFIAEHTASSIRELEGRLLQVTAQASLLKTPVTLQLAEEIIGTDSAEVEITPEIIIEATAEFYALDVAELIGPGKTRPVSHARQVAMYLTRSLIDISLPAIGKVFGNRDHSTVLYAHRKIQKEIQDKRATRDQVNDLTTRIRERSRTGH